MKAQNVAIKLLCEQSNSLFVFLDVLSISAGTIEGFPHLVEKITSTVLKSAVGKIIDWKMAYLEMERIIRDVKATLPISPSLLPHRSKFITVCFITVKEFERTIEDKKLFQCWFHTM